MKDDVHGHCFVCGFYGDIFDKELKFMGIDPENATKEERGEAVRRVAARYNFPLSGSHISAAEDFKPEPKPEPEQPHSFADKLAAWHSALKGSEGEAYLRRRGITQETMDRFNLGFGTDTANRPCVVFAYPDNAYYVTRTIIDNADKPYRFPAGVKSPLYNVDALYQKEPCFIVESQICAISIMQEGGSALALGGVSGINRLLETIKDKRPSAMLILSLDNDPVDEQGNKQKGPLAQEKLAAELEELKIPHLEYNVAGDCKDPNELLQIDPARLRGSIASVIEIANAMQEEEKNREKKEYEAQTAAASFDRFTSFLTENGERPPIPTGFNNLDRVLNGGLSAGLYIMGAISSLGKTSWMLNIADNIAAAGRDVLYFSLEMSRNELIAKSVSRFSFRAVGEISGPEDDAFSTFEVLNCRSRSFTMDQEKILDKAFQAYREGPGRRMWIFEGVGDFGVDEITQRVEDHIRITGRKPVVFIDYLQILAPADPRSTDKQNTDKAVVELKRLSAKHDIPVFCISSLNRQNYSEPITMAAFKESGAIEYGSDVLIGIQLYGIGYQPGEKPGNAHTARIREIIEKAEKDKRIDIEIRVLKNRNGGRGGSGRLLFNKKYNFFSEVPDGFTYSDVPDSPFDDESKEDGWETVTK